MIAPTRTNRTSPIAAVLALAAALCLPSPSAARAEGTDDATSGGVMAIHAVDESGHGTDAWPNPPAETTPDTQALRRLLSADSMSSTERYRLERLLMNLHGDVG